MSDRKPKKFQDKAEELQFRDLDGIVGGSSEYATLTGGEQDDSLYGGDGSSHIDGGAGDDTLDGGYGDGASDVLAGGDGNDAAYWGLSGDGSDTFDGGAGDDVLYLDGLNGSSVQDAIQGGQFTLSLTDADGNPLDVTDDMFDEHGNLLLGEGVTGSITGPNGDTMTFQNVEAIGSYADQSVDPNLIGGDMPDIHSGTGGDDTLDGGLGDNDSDLLLGGTGDDVAYWGISGDGDDVFNGGEGDDVLYLDGLDSDTSVHDAWAGGQFTIALTDADGNPLDVTDDMFDADGNLLLPEGVTGTITGPDGDTLGFVNVEAIGNYHNQSVEQEGETNSGNDALYGGSGSSVLDGGAGDDTLDGGFGDNADDTGLGGDGDDVFIWGISGDGNDTFDGGAGNDTLELDGLGGSTVQDAMAAGTIQLSLTDADGNPVDVTADMFDANGNLVLPGGVTGGTITGPNGQILTFTNVEIITPY